MITVERAAPPGTPAEVMLQVVGNLISEQLAAYGPITIHSLEAKPAELTIKFEPIEEK